MGVGSPSFIVSFDRSSPSSRAQRVSLVVSTVGVEDYQVEIQLESEGVRRSKRREDRHSPVSVPTLTVTSMVVGPGPVVRLHLSQDRDGEYSINWRSLE